MIPILTQRASLRAALFIVLVARFFLSVAYCIAVPLGEAPDEADHYAYAAYIGREGRLPDGPWMTQAKHPPLFYLLAALPAAATSSDISFLRSNPDVSLAHGSTVPNFFVHTSLEDWPYRGGALAMHLGRSVSIGAGLALTLATYLIGRTVWPRRPAVALGAAAFVAFLPESLFIGSSMSNDMLAAALAAWALWAGLRFRADAPAPVSGWHWPLLSGALAGLALLTKFSAVAVWPAIALGMLLSARPEPRRSWRALIPPAAGSAALALVAAPWLLRNILLFGDPLAMSLVEATVDRRLAPLHAADLWWLLRGWFHSFWGKFGAAGHLSLPEWQYVLWAAILILVGAGWTHRGLRRVRAGDGLAGEAHHLLPLVLPPILVALSIVSYSQVALGTDQGRLLFPALAPIGLLIAAGLINLVPERSDVLATSAWAALMAGTAVAALMVGILLPFAPPAAPPAAQVADTEPVGQSLGDMHLVAAHWDRQGSGRLLLYWQADRPLPADYRTLVRLLDADGHPVWEWKRSPGSGRYSTDRWTPGRVVADVYAPPAGTLERAVRVEVRVYAFPDGGWLAVGGSESESTSVVLQRPQG
jgi:4-amino-4-deoxy-L-arabinose transferase-like glycosyltransferase